MLLFFSIDMSGANFNPTSVCYSPPTKQTRTQALQQDPDPLLNESVRSVSLSTTFYALNLYEDLRQWGYIRITLYLYL
jgi:hypothetical protein